jgi:hypothetical protein
MRRPASPAVRGRPREIRPPVRKMQNPDTTGMSHSKSGSGTSTSGGKDANGDQGRDKMPDSSQGVRPYDQQNKPPK